MRSEIRKAAHHWQSPGAGFLALWVLLLSLAACSPASEMDTDERLPPLLGEWIGETMNFQITEDGVHRLELKDFGCTGNFTPAGFPLCTSLLNGPYELPSPVPVTDEGVRFDTPFGLQIEGQFDDSSQFEGTVVYTAENACCETSGALRIVHETIAKEEPVLPCHSPEAGGSESVWLLAPNPEDNLPLEEDMRSRLPQGSREG